MAKLQMGNLSIRNFFSGNATANVCPRRLSATLGLLLPLGVGQPAQADSLGNDADLDSELKFLAAERQFVVTASKMRERVDQSVAATSVITADDIRQMGARNLLDVLRIVPGLGITQSALGAREIEVRGVKGLFSTKVLFMLNGHPLDDNLQNSGSTWVYDDLPVDTIKRVEVVRGPGSALYGANAFLAVINIITLTAKDLNGLQTSVGVGSFNNQQYRASWGKQFANSAEAALHFNYTTTDGIGSPVPHDSLSLQGQPSVAPGKSQLDEGRYDVEWQTGYRGVHFDGRYISKRTGAFIGPGAVLSDRTVQDYDNYFLKLSKTWQITEQFSVDSQVFHDSFSFNNMLQLQPGFFDQVALQDTRTGGELQGNYRVDDQQTVIAGFSYTEDQQTDVVDRAGISPALLQDRPPFGKPRGRQRWGLYAQDVWDPFDNLRLTLGARYDEYNDFGGTFNPRLGFNWEFVKDYSLRFAYGTAYRAPAFGELDLTNNPVLAGNPNLAPEEAETFEAGIIAHPVAGLRTQATYYHTHISQLISEVPAQTTLIQYANSGSLVSEGVELEGRYDFDGVLQGSYFATNVVYQRPTAANGSLLAEVPQARANVLMNYAFGEHWNAFGHVLIKDSINHPANDGRSDIPGYALFDLSLLGQNFFAKHLDVSFTVYNLFDQTYFDPSPPNSGLADFQQAGRAYFGHINVRY
ncbi:MAG: TonB-dependent receptor [Methylovulum sp.]|nr:TonB-dependent receptor [Methylovulum sp.]